MAGAASALFLLDIKGRVLIWRDYRGDVPAAQAERFFTKFIEKEVRFPSTFLSLFLCVFLSLIDMLDIVRVQGDPQSQDPVVYENGVTYMFIQHNNVYLMAASRQNCNAASLLLFLHRAVEVPTP